MPKSANWREEGVYRMTLELPMGVRRRLLAEAEARGVMPGRLVVAVLDEKLPALAPDAKVPEGRRRAK